jgi:hypothetical protein
VQSKKTSEPGSSATSVTVSFDEAIADENGSWGCASWVAQESGSISGWEILGQASHASPVASLMTACSEEGTPSATFSWTTSAPKGAIILEILGAVPEVLHTVQDDWNLRANADTERSEGMGFLFDYYLTDTAGNYLTDTAGNRLIARDATTLYPQVLHAVQDDWKLNSE